MTTFGLMVIDLFKLNELTHTKKTQAVLTTI